MNVSSMLLEAVIRRVGGLEAGTAPAVAAAQLSAV